MTRDKRIPLGKLKGTSQDVIFNLPGLMNEGIGKVIMTHAILETQVSELMYDLAQIDYPAGRVSFGYRNAGDRFNRIIALLDMHGIEPSISIKKLKEQIKDCCSARDTLAHNVWIKNPNTGDIGVRLAKGTFDTPHGKLNLQVLPHGHVLPERYFDGTVKTIIATIAVVLDLKKEVKAELEKQKSRSGQP